MKNLPLFSTPQNNKTPLLHPAKTCHEKINGERCSWSLFCLSRGKHPHLSLDQSCPTGAAGTRRGTGQGLSCSNMARSCSQQLCPHQHCWRIGRDPSHPFWDHQATGAHPPSTQSTLRDGGKGSEHLNPLRPLFSTAAMPSWAAHGAHPPLPGPPGGFSLPYPGSRASQPPRAIAASPARAGGRHQRLSGWNLHPREWPGQERCQGPSFPGEMRGVCFAGNAETADGRAPGERGCPHSRFRH